MLEIKGDGVNSFGSIAIDTDGDGNYGFIDQGVNGTGIGLRGAGPQDGTQVCELYAKAGKVGIGTETPQKQLHIVGEMRYEHGTPEVGQVLTCTSTDGNVAWEDSTGGGGEGAIVRSSAFTPTSIGLESRAHGLGSVPVLFGATAICTTAENGWDVGDEVILNTQVDGSHTSNTGAPTTVYADSTAIYFRTQGEPGYFVGEIPTPDGSGIGGEAGLTPGNWDVVLWWFDNNGGTGGGGAGFGTVWTSVVRAFGESGSLGTIGNNSQNNNVYKRYRLLSIYKFNNIR